MNSASLARRLVGLLGSLLLAMPLDRAHATTVVPVHEADLVVHAVAIVVGEVTAIEGVKAQDGQVFTHVTIAVDDVLHGDVPPGDLTIRQVGGVVGDTVAWIEGSPEFVRGERVLVFLRESRDGTLRVAHLYQGKFTLLADAATGEEWAYRDTPEGVRVLPSPSGAAAVHLRHLGDFKREIRRHLRRLRVPRRPGLITAPMLPLGAATASAEAFTFLGTPARWFEPDTGLGVPIMMNVGGQPGAPGLGFDAIRAALAAWSTVAGSSFRFEDGGFTSAQGFRSDGVSAISFGDPLGQIDPPAGCSGVLAIGGYARSNGESRIVNGQSFLRIVEGDVVVADGWAGCGFYENPVNFAEVMTHELGHALGLGHSADPAATMAPVAHWDGRGASLGADDVAALRFVYPAVATPAPLLLGFVNPTAGATVRGTVTVTLQATGGSGLVYAATVDGAPLYAGSNATFSWNTTAVPNGLRRLGATVRDAAGRTASADVAVTVANTTPPALTLAYRGMVRDRVGRGATALGADGLPDGVFTVGLGAGSGARTVTGLRLTSSAGGTWDTDPATPYWVLGAAASLDGALASAPSSAVNLPVADGGAFAIFAADSSPTLFAPGAVFTLTASFADGSTAATTLTVTAASPPALAMTWAGPARDRVGRGAAAVTADGLDDCVFTVRLAAGTGARTVVSLRLSSESGGTWDTDPSTIYWALGLAASLDAPLVNTASSAATLALADGGTFAIFAADSSPTLCAPGTAFTLAAAFADGSTARASATVAVAAGPPLTITYDGLLRDRVGRGPAAVGGDGLPDGVFTARLAPGSGARTIAGLQLRSSTGGTWDTAPESIFWALGVAGSLDGPLLNDASSAATLAVADGGAFTVFAADVSPTLLAPGTTVTLTATFADGSASAATVTLGASPEAPLTLAYDGALRDRVGRANGALLADGFLDGVFTVRLRAGSGARTVRSVELRSAGNGGVWDTTTASIYWTLGVAGAVDAPLANGAQDAVSLAVADGGSFALFASDLPATLFAPETVFTVTVGFADGTTAIATTTAP
jgi:hypothetical protein